MGNTLIYTSSWSTVLPESCARIGISRGVRNQPAGYRLYRALQPDPQWRNCASNTEFKSRYFALLDQLCPQRVVLDLVRIADGKTPVLLCWEPPGHPSKWCHRGLAAAWLHDELGLRVCEYGHEAEGWGWAHPLLPPEFRQPATLGTQRGCAIH